MARVLMHCEPGRVMSRGVRGVRSRAGSAGCRLVAHPIVCGPSCRRGVGVGACFALAGCYVVADAWVLF